MTEPDIDTDAPASEQFDLSHGAAFEATVETLDEAAHDDILPDDAQAKFDHIIHQGWAGAARHPRRQGVRIGRENLRRERRELQTYLDHLEAKDP